MYVVDKKQGRWHDTRHGHGGISHSHCVFVAFHLAQIQTARRHATTLATDLFNLAQ